MGKFGSSFVANLVLVAGFIVTLLAYPIVLGWFGFDWQLLRSGSSYWGPGRWIGLLGFVVILMCWGFAAEWVRNKLRR